MQTSIKVSAVTFRESDTRGGDSMEESGEGPSCNVTFEDPECNCLMEESVTMFLGSCQL